MRITIDTEAETLQVAEGGAAAEHSLFSPEAFRILSRQWIALGWNLGHWRTFSWMGRQLLQLPDHGTRIRRVPVAGDQPRGQLLGRLCTAVHLVY